MLLRPVLMPILRNPLQGIADGIRNMLAELLGSSQFFAPLTHSLVLARGTGSTTFTRADATNCATFRDWEGVLKTVPSGCARFEGARMVRNLLTFTEDFSNAAWTKNEVTLSAATAPDGTTTATLVKPSAVSTALHRVFQSPSATTAQLSIYAKAGGYNFLRLFSNSISAVFDLSTGTIFSGTGTIEDSGDGWYRCSATGAASTSAIFLVYSDGAGNAFAGDTTSGIYLWHPSLNDITGETDQTTIRPYVSVGAPSDWAGTDLVTNGTFDTDTSGWTAKNIGSLSVVSGKLRVTNGVFGGAEQVVTTVVGVKYVVSRNFTAGTSTACITQIGTSAGANNLYDSGIVSTVNLSAEFTATSTTTYIQVYLGDGTVGNYADFDNISVKPAYYHGSMVDGVEFFNTDRDGAVIPAATNTGYLAEGARTNLCLQSQTFATTWTKVNAGDTVTSDSVVAPDGTTTADTLTGAAVNIQKGLTQGFSNFATGTPLTFSVYLKYSTQQFVQFLTNTGADGYANFDLVNGTTSSSTATSQIVAMSNGWYRCSITVTCSGATTNWYILFANSLASTRYEATTSVGVLPMWGAQYETGSFASTYIPTTTAAVTRAADVDANPTASNILAAASTVYLEFTPDHTPSGTIALWGTYVDASNYTAILHDATNMIMRKRIAGVNYDATIANAFTANTTYKVCGSWGASGVTVTLDGTEGTANANTTAAQIAATMQWGADGNSLQQPFATERNARVWQRQLSASERGAITA